MTNRIRSGQRWLYLYNRICSNSRYHGPRARSHECREAVDFAFFWHQSRQSNRCQGISSVCDNGWSKACRARKKPYQQPAPASDTVSRHEHAEPKPQQKLTLEKKDASPARSRVSRVTWHECSIDLSIYNVHERKAQHSKYLPCSVSHATMNMIFITFSFYLCFFFICRVG